MCWNGAEKQLVVFRFTITTELPYIRKIVKTGKMKEILLIKMDFQFAGFILSADKDYILSVEEPIVVVYACGYS